MLKLIIVEDEDIVVRGFKKIINWQGLNISLEGCATNGRAALEMIERKKPDIILTDIKMPKSDGIELLTEIKKAAIKCQIIVISGYSDFQYMKQAIRTGVYEYILKPVSKDDLNRVLGELCRVIKNEKEEQKQLMITQEKIEESQLIMQGRLLDLFLNGTYVTNKHYSKYSDILKNKYSYKYYQVTLLNYGFLSSKNKIEFNEFETNIKNRIAGLDFQIELSWETGNNLIIVAKLNVVTENSVNMGTQKLLTLLIDEIAGKDGNMVKIGIGEILEGFEGIHISYHQAGLALTYEKIEGPNIIYYRNIEKYCNRKILERIDTELDEVKRQLESGEVVILENIFDLIISNNTIHGYIDLGGIKKQLIDLLIFVDRTCRMLNVEIDRIYAKEKSLIQEIEDIMSFMQLKNWFLEMTNGLKNLLYGKKAHTSIDIIEEIKLFITNNYHKEINLITIADRYYMNHIYLSRIFKTQTGENFIDYVTRIRMEKAIKLLKKGGFRVKEVAAMTGYSNPYYFSKVFSKYFGKSPTEILL